MAARRTIRITLICVSAVFTACMLVTIACVLFVSPSDDSRPLAVTEDLSAGSPEFLQALAHLEDVPIGQGSSVSILDNGDQFVPALISGIDSASSSIEFDTYIVSAGTFSNQVFAALDAAALRGVKVRMLLDGLGARNASSSQVAALERDGGIVAWYHPFTLSDPIEYDVRDHMRAIVIDGRIGFTGGMAVADYWLGDGVTPGKWRDMMFEVKGAMAESLESDFAEVWNEADSEALAGPLFYPPVQSAQSGPSSAYVNIASMPSDGRDPVRDAFLLTISSAKKTLYITNAYLIPDPAIISALEHAAESGVDARILSPGPATIGAPLRDAWHGYYAELLAAGVKLYEYQPTMIHAKTMVADDSWSLIGSANLDNRSEYINDEDLLGIADPVLASALDATFMQDLSHSEQITAAEWSAQSWFSRVWSDAMLVFAKQL